MNLSKNAVYYTDNKLNSEIMLLCQQQLHNSFKGDIISVSLKPLEFGNNIVLNLERGYSTMFKQILTGLENSNADIIFLTEHDILYHPSHFEFVPEKKDTFYYNTNVWKFKYPSGPFVWTDDLQQVSGCCAYRELLIDFYSKKIQQVNFDRHFEPGLKQTVGSNKVENWKSEFPNIDIRHSNNLTVSKWKPEDFRNKKYAEGWKESESVSGWEEV
jgi:hypothetical protein